LSDSCIGQPFSCRPWDHWEEMEMLWAVQVLI
jgi:hypothetical protein